MLSDPADCFTYAHILHSVFTVPFPFVKKCKMSWAVTFAVVRIEISLTATGAGVTVIPIADVVTVSEG